MTEQPTDRDPIRQARLDSLGVLLTRITNGLTLTQDEVRLLVEHVGTEVRDGTTARALASAAAAADSVDAAAGSYALRAETAEAERDGAYRERAHLVALLAALYPAHIGYTDPATIDWLVVTIETPTGQMSWHIAERDRDLFEHVRLVVSTHNVWDGHTTDEKYARLRELTRITPGLPWAPTSGEAGS